MDIAGFKNISELYRQRKETMKRLSYIDSQIEEQQKNCEHVGVILGYTGDFPCRDTIIEQCLFCGRKSLGVEVPSFNAISYLRNFYSRGDTEKDRQGRLLKLQTLWFSYAEQFPYATNEEIIEMMKQAIEEDEEKNQELEKILGISLI